MRTLFETKYQAAYNNFIQPTGIRANQGSNKASATVEAIAPGIDLAVLKLEDETFFHNHQPLERANALPMDKW